MIRILLILFFCVNAKADAESAGQLTPPPPADQPLTLEQAVQLGIRNATLALKRENDVRIGGAQLLKAYGNFLPSLTASASITDSSGRSFEPLNGGADIDSSFRTTRAGIGADWNLFRGFGDLASLRAAHDRRDAADLSLERARQEIALDITQAFWTCALNDQVTAIAEQTLQVSRDREKLLNAQNKLGSANLADLYRQQAQTATDQLNLSQAKNRAEASRLLLFMKLRLDARQPVRLALPDVNKIEAHPTSGTEAAWIDEALKNRGDLKAQDRRADAAEDDVQREAGAYFPTLDLIANYGGQGVQYQRYDRNGVPTDLNVGSTWDQLNHNDIWTLSLNLTWTFFDGWTTTSRVRTAQAVASNARIDRDDMFNDVVIEMKQALLDYGTALEQLNSALAGREAAEKAFRLIEGRYRLGSSSFIDLVTAQAAREQAEVTRAQALVNFRLREEGLNLSAGRKNY